MLAQPARDTPPYCFLHSVFTPAECDRLVALGRGPLALLPATVGDAEPRQDAAQRVSQVAWVESLPAHEWIFARLAEAACALRAWYPFHLSGFLEPLQLTRYDGGRRGHYGEHRDLGRGDQSVRKLSMSVQLSDPDSYAGGALEVRSIPGRHKAVVERARGTLIAFPSFELHRVRPVTRGERWSLVAWLHGPPWA